MINNLSYLHLWKIIIPNYNTLRKTIPNHDTFWEKITLRITLFGKNNPFLNQKTQVKPSSFDNGRKGIFASQPVFNLNTCHLQFS